MREIHTRPVTSPRTAFLLTLCGAALFALALAVPAFAQDSDSTRTLPAYPHGRFRAPCQQCHDDHGWKPARIARSFDHTKVSGFALSGAHTAASCLGCHRSLEFERAEKRCASCHSDPHLGEFGPDCARCHTSRSFVDRAGMVRLHQLTRFALTGAHAGVECTTCHPATAQGRMRFTGTAPQCRSCHEPGTQPAHTGFSTQCERCHTTITWQPARFDHAGAGFPLTCPHRAPVTCVQCHGTPWVTAISRECVSCHRDRYDATANPPHSASGFPTACATCHDVKVCGWTGASFNHDRFFPIASGRHSNIGCAKCHTTPSDFAAFSCLTACHSQSTTDSRHREVGSYVYQSAACYRCHPKGQAGD